MSNATRARPIPKAPATPRRSPLSGWVVGGIVAALVAVAAVIAVVATAGDDGGDVPAGVEQTRPVTVSGAALPQFGDAAPDPAVGMEAPTLTGAEFDGTPLMIAPGQPTLVVFLAHWCPHCQREVPLLTEWAAGGGVPAGARVVGVATATTADRPNYPPSAWLEREDFPFPVMADSAGQDASAAYGLSSFPYFVALDSDGRVVSRASGEVDPATLTALLTSLE